MQQWERGRRWSICWLYLVHYYRLPQNPATTTYHYDGRKLQYQGIGFTSSAIYRQVKALDMIIPTPMWSGHLEIIYTSDIEYIYYNDKANTMSNQKQRSY